MNNQDWSWAIAMWGGFALICIAIFTFVFAAVCTVKCIRGKYSARPLLLYWFTTVTAVTLSLVFNQIQILALVLLVSPFFLTLLWYYDKKASEQFYSAQTPTHDVNND